MGVFFQLKSINFQRQVISLNYCTLACKLPLYFSSVLFISFRLIGSGVDGSVHSTTPFSYSTHSTTTSISSSFRLLIVLDLFAGLGRDTASPIPASAVEAEELNATFP